MGSMDKESSFKLLDAFYEAGGNFIDTAVSYQSPTNQQFWNSATALIKSP
jgi:aryl-alcohol dehydrogenase-like predicted oxidoreductase